MNAKCPLLFGLFLFIAAGSRGQPTITVTTPKSRSTVSSTALTNGLFTAQGTATGNNGIAAVYYSLNQSPFAVASGTTSWSAAGLALQPGSNTFAAYAVDNHALPSRTNTVAFTYVVFTPIRISIAPSNSWGSVKTPTNEQPIQIQKKITMTATASTGFKSVGWMLNGTNFSGAATISIEMQSNLDFTAVFEDITRPVCVATYPATKHSVSNSPITATIRAMDKFVPVTNVFYQVNSNGWNAASPAGDGTNWTASVAPAPGQNTLQTYAADAVGNLSLTNKVQFGYVVAASKVAPVATNGSISQVSISLVFGTSNYLAAIQGDSTASNNISAQLLATNGSAIGSRIGIGRTGSTPQVSFDGTNYLVVWCDDALLNSTGNFVIYGQFVSQSGELVGSPFNITDTSAYAQWGSLQSIAFDGTNYFVVWADQSQHNAPPGNAYGVFVSTAGTVASPILLSANALEPGVVFGGDSYLVYWENREATVNEAYNADGEFVTKDGTVGSSFAVSQTTSPSYNPLCGGFDGTNYLLVWNKNIGPGSPQPTQWNLDGRLVSTNGSFPGNEVALVADKGQPVFPFVAFDGSDYLLAWHEGAPLTTSPSQVSFHEFNSALAPAGAAFTLFNSQGGNAPLLGSVASGDGQFAILGVVGGFSGSFTGPLPAFTPATATYGVILP